MPASANIDVKVEAYEKASDGPGGWGIGEKLDSGERPKGPSGPGGPGGFQWGNKGGDNNKGPGGPGGFQWGNKGEGKG